MHLAGSPGSYFAYLRDCLKEWSEKLECTLSMAEQKIYISIETETKYILQNIHTCVTSMKGREKILTMIFRYLTLHQICFQNPSLQSRNSNFLSKEQNTCTV